jgi:putative ABC transport system permease protein
MEQIAQVVGILLGVLLSTLGAVLVLSVPLTLAVAVRVVLRREWVPVTYNVRSLSGRPVSTLATFAGLVLVVFVLAFMLMLAQGVETTLEAAGSPSNVKVVRENRLTEWNSRIGPEVMTQISAADEIAKNAAGQPLISGEMVVLTWLPYLTAKSPDDGANVTVRGVGPMAFEVHAIAGIEGRSAKPGEHELVLGRSLVGRFEGAVLGGAMRFADREWRVVGIADHGASAYDSEIWGDVDVLGGAFRRGLATASLVLRDPSELPALQARIAANPELAEIACVREDVFWKALSRNYVEFITLLGCAMAVVFGFGAMLGAMNTMFAQVSARTREIGALRAIGFKPRAILTSIVFESLLLALAAGATGVLAASLLGSVQFQFTSGETLSEISYRLHMTMASACACLGFAALMGYAGGVLPALRASAMPIVSAIRSD